MKCPKCDYISQDASPNFCSSCGFRLVPHISTQSMEKGRRMGVTWVYCLADCRILQRGEVM